MILNKSQIMEKKPSAGGAGYKYYRLSQVNENKTPVGYGGRLEDFRLFTDVNLGGTEYPTTALTSDTSESGITTSAGHVYSTNAAWKAFDSSSATYWWPFTGTAANQWIQIAFDTAKDIKCIQLNQGTTYWSFYWLLEGSNTGAFSGEETELAHWGGNDVTVDTITLDGNGYPTMPTGLTIGSRTTSSITFSWTASTVSEGSILYYEYQLNDGTWTSTGSTSTSKTVSGLSSNTTYTVRVRAVSTGVKKGNPCGRILHYTNAVGHTYTQSSGSGSYTYYRLHACTSTGTHTTSDAAIGNIEFHTGTGQSGTEYPTTNLTSATSESGITISHGYAYNSTYHSWKAFDLTTGSMWWTLGSGVTAATNWIQLQKSSAFTAQSMQLYIKNSYNDCSGFQIYGSNTGAFSGEETTIGRITNLNEGDRDRTYNFNL